MPLARRAPRGDRDRATGARGDRATARPRPAAGGGPTAGARVRAARRQRVPGVRARPAHFAGDRLLALSGADPRTATALQGAFSLGRAIDRGNATWRSIGDDYERLGIATAAAQGDAADRRSYAELIALRNALAHANDRQLARLRSAGVRDTVTWARSRLPALNRQARALDRLAWSHLVGYQLGEPW